MTTRERILVIRLGALGDLVLCFQTFRDIHAAHPNAEIALLTMPAFAGFARSMPWFTSVIVDERPSFLQIGRWWKLIRSIREFAPTRVYDLQGKTRQTLLYFLLGCPEWSGAAPGCKYPRPWPPDKGMHFTDFIAAQLRLANVPAASPANLDWLNTPVDKFALPERFAMLIPGCAPGREYKRWAAVHYAEIAQRLLSQGIQSIAVGTTSDADAIAAIRQTAPDVIDLSGKTNLLELAALARKTVCVIGNDTGPVHLAASVGAPTLALMSERVDPTWSAPRGPRAQWLQGTPLADLSTDKVFLALKSILDKTA